LGRKDGDGVITLKLDGAGALEFRDADSAGYVPVGTYAEFQLINTAPGGMSGKYKQEADLDLLGAVGYDGGQENWVPIDDGYMGFTGEFDGAGHTINNLYISHPWDALQGLFGYNYGTLKNIRIASGSVSGLYYTGGVAGENYGTITACYNNGTVLGRRHLGGVAGENYGTINACYNTGAVSGAMFYVGGIAGRNSGTINASYNAGVVSGSDGVGGVAGTNDTLSTITASYNTGTVSGSDGVGGVLGYADAGTITACYNTGAVSGTTIVGGVAGYQSFGTITACYWDSSVSPHPANGIGEPAGDTDAAPFNDAAAFPPVTAANAEWGAGDGSGSGKYWKAGTTGGGQLPKLWWE
jgi:hypothetical protein